MGELFGIRDFRNSDGNIFAGPCPVGNPENQNGENRAHRAQGHQAKAVVFRIAVASDRRNAHAQSHDKRHGHGAGSDAAGIKGHRKKFPGNKLCQQEDKSIYADQQVGELDTEQHTQHGNHKENTHSYSHGDDQRHVGDAGNLFGQNLEIRFGHGDKNTHQKAYQHHQPDTS